MFIPSRNECPEKREKGKLEVRLAAGFDLKTLDDILSIEKAVFGADNMYDAAEDHYAGRLRDSRNVNILAVENGETIAYLLAIPKTEAFSDEDLREADPDFHANPEDSTYYIEVAETLADHRKGAVFLGILRKLADELRIRGAKGISMHARVENGLSDFTVRFLEKIATMKERRVIEHWPFYEGDEPTMYIEAEDPTGTWGMRKE